ncbi:hypothetical protein Tco_0797638 [Tanacetum coccineum]
MSNWKPHPQKEETFQVVIDLIKNSTCFKAFTISADIPKIFMQQFWYSIKKVQGMDSYEFLLANKKCVVNADVFRTILDICPTVEGVNFTDVPDDYNTLAFLIKLGYKRPLYKHTNMFVDHMHQPWRTLAAIINKCLSRKTTSNDKHRKSRIDILWGIVCSEPARKKTSSKRRVNKKVTLSADDNIISDDPNTALELGKSISKTEAEEADQQGKSMLLMQGLVFHLLLQKNKKVLILCKLSKKVKKTSKTQPGTRGSNKGTGTIPGVPDESTVVFATSNEGTSTKLGVPDEEIYITEENVILEWGSEQESKYSKKDQLSDEEKDNKDDDADDEGDGHISDTKDTDDEDDETESDEDEIYKYKIRVRKYEDEEMLNAKDEDSDKGDEEVTDAAKADAEKTSVVKDDAKKTELPLTSSSLSVSSSFGDQFLKLSSNSSLVSTVKDATDAEINSLFEVKIQSEVPHN